MTACISGLSTLSGITRARLAWLAPNMCASRADFSAALSAALLTTEAALYLSGKKPAAELVIAPAVTYIDLFERSFEIFTPEITAKN